jgi:hypothetical protein
MVNRAEFSTRDAFLFTDFGEEMARRYFPEEKIESLGRFVRGKHKGRLRGKITWVKVTRGGWVQVYPGLEGGYVEPRVGKVIEVRLQTAPWGEEPETVAYWQRGN